MPTPHKRRKTSVYDSIIFALIVALIIILINTFNSFLPKELGQNFIYLIDAVIIVIVLCIVFIRSHRI
jgi:uncharacterized membrane protein